MADIKTRDAVKGTIKTIDKSAVAAERMKDAFIRTKEKADHSYYSAENSPEEYAAVRVTGGAEAVTFGATHEFDKHGRKAVQDTKENISKAKDYLEQRKAAQPQEAAKKAAAKAQKTARAAQQPSQTVTGTWLINTYHSLMVVSLTTDPVNLWDPNTGMLAEGPIVKEAAGKLPFKNSTYRAVKDSGARFPCYVEMYDTDGTTLISQGAQFSLMGDYSLMFFRFDRFNRET